MGKMKETVEKFVDSIGKKVNGDVTWGGLIIYTVILFVVTKLLKNILED